MLGHISTDKSIQSRRTILKWTGGGVAMIALSGGFLPNFGISSALAADLGSGDFGILNYAYALEQLEAAFYTKVVSSPYADMPEVEHREFLKKALADKAIPELEVDFSKVDFTKRESVLGTAKVFEDLGVSAYNGAGKLIKNADYLLAAGKIVSVEARHAATIRDLLQPGSIAFAGMDVVNKNGLDGAKAPAEVLKAAGPFIKTEVTANQIIGMK